MKAGSANFLFTDMKRTHHLQLFFILKTFFPENEKKIFAHCFNALLWDVMDRRLNFAFVLERNTPLTFKTKTDVGSLDRRPETESEFGGFIKKFGDRYNLEGGEVGIEEPFFVPVLCLTVPCNAQGRSAA